VIAWIILLIACINFMNLATATAQKRAKEVGVRKVLGVGKRGLVLKFMGEALLMSALSALAGVFLMLMALPAFNGLMGKHLQLRLTDPAQLVSLVFIVLVCGVVAGSYPAFYLSSFNPISVLKGLKMQTGGAPLVRKGLVVLQFAVSVVFIVSTLVVFLQIQHIRNRDLGFNRDKLIEVNPERKIESIFPLIRNELMQTRLVENVALADHVTLYGGDTDDRFKWQGKAEGSGVSIAHRNVTPEYISTSGMKIIAGRDFRENDEADASNVIINESMARLMSAGSTGGAGSAASAVGKVIQSPRNQDGSYANMTVIGVIRDYIYGNVHDGGAAPVILFRKAPEYGNVIYVRPRAQANLAQVLAAVEAVMKKENPAYPPEYEFVDEEFNRMFANDTQTSQVSGVFAVLAVLISCLGLFGLATYTAEQRTKEIGIRKVLGASVAGVSGMLTRNFLVLVGVACLIAFPVAWWIMHNWLQDFEYRISLRWWMFGAAGAAAVLIALVTVGSQAMKAALANPVISLRSE
jgi:putative ABC transport system permease protein